MHAHTQHIYTHIDSRYDCSHDTPGAPAVIVVARQTINCTFFNYCSIQLGLAGNPLL